MSDSVNHPSHYTRGKIEVIDFIEDQQFNYRLGNAVKYLCRAGYKNDKAEDLRKAIWYIQRELNAIQCVDNDLTITLKSGEKATLPTRTYEFGATEQLDDSDVNVI